MVIDEQAWRRFQSGEPADGSVGSDDSIRAALQDGRLRVRTDSGEVINPIAAAGRDQPDEPGSASGPAQRPVGGVRIAALEEQLEATRAERDEAKDKVLRTFAELDTVRRRKNEELDKAKKYRSMALAKDLLPHVDNLRRALDASVGDGVGDEERAIVEGVQMVLGGIEETMRSHGIVPVVVEPGDAFDPNVHEALSQVPRAQMPDAEPMSIVQVVERGYAMHDQLIRPSKVIVVASE